VSKRKREKEAVYNSLMQSIVHERERERERESEVEPVCSEGEAEVMHEREWLSVAFILSFSFAIS